MSRSHTERTDGGDAEEPDLEAVLFAAGAVAETEEGEDLRLDDAFRTEWYERARDVRSGETLEESIRAELDANELPVVAEWGDELVVEAEERPVAWWPSRAAAVADFAGDRALRERYEDWDEFDLTTRSRILRSLRMFLDRCPVCEDHAASEKVRAGCPPDHAKLVVHCPACDATLFESAPQVDLPDAEPDLPWRRPEPDAGT